MYLPTQFQGFLSFGDSVIGRVCYTVPEILQAAAESYLLKPIPPHFLADRVLIDACRAMDLLETMDVDVQKGKTFARHLSNAIAR